MGPTVIGGIGGSGTRVIADIVAKAGYHIGTDLNRAKDNLTYTLLFRRPRWFYRHHDDRKAISTGLALFEKLMLRRRRPSLAEIAFLVRATLSVAIYGHTWEGLGKGSWPLSRLQQFLVSKRVARRDCVGWGWKEPNSHLLIEHLAAQFPDFRYIHTIRHGLDMAFSRNQKQLYNWGPLYGVARPAHPAEEPSASLKYWIAANDRVYRLRERLGQDRLLIINFDELCRSPADEIPKLLRFLGVELDPAALAEVLAVPRRPSSTGRYRSEDLGQFDATDLQHLPRFGFAIH